MEGCSYEIFNINRSIDILNEKSNKHLICGNCKKLNDILVVDDNIFNIVTL